MNKANKYATSNLRMLEYVARKLGVLNDEVVYLGGCTTALFITDPLALDVRPTLDVDCIIDVISRGEYQKFEKKLRAQGFQHSLNDNIICRWCLDDIVLDVMPTDEKILGWGNPWYKEAVENAVTYSIDHGISIRLVTVPYFLATKIEAFKSRGNNDFLGSHDFEDIITVIAGREETEKEVATASPTLRLYLQSIFSELLKNEECIHALPGHLNDGPVTMQRVKIVMERIKKIAIGPET